MLNSLRQDLRYAARMLLARPAFTCAAVLTLALGIGANSAIFSVIDAVLLRPLAYAQPQRLVSFQSNQSGPDLADVAAANHTLASIGGEVLAPLAWTGGDEPVQLAVGQVSGGFFATLGIGAARGRAIGPADDVAGAPFVVVLSHALWQERFGADPAIVGRTLPLAGNIYTVIGVMPAGFAAPQSNAQAWTPVHVSNAGAANFRSVHFLRTIARLQAGVSIEQARAEMAVIDRQLASRYPADNRNRHSELVPLKERVVGASRGTLLVLFAAVCLVLLIACANFANLLLARACERGREIGVRMALGAGRARLVRQLLVESVLLALGGGALGALLAWLGTRALVAAQPDGLPRLGEIGVDPRVFAFTFATALLTGIVFGLFPAWTAARSGGAGDDAARGVSAGRAQQRLRSAFVVAQLAVALVLLVGAGLLVRTFWNLRSVDPGFRPAQLLTLRVELPETRYRGLAEQTRFRTAALDAIDALPGAHAAMVSELPLSGESLNHDFLVDGWPPVAPGDEPSVETRSVLGDYFAVMGIALRGGRDFAATDFNADAPRVGIANDALVRKYFAGENPLGKRVRWARQDTVEWITIVGVAADVHHFGLERPDLPALYSPYTQAEPWTRWMTFVVRTQGDPLALAPAVKQAIWHLDSQLPITRLRPMRVVAADSVAARRFDMLLLALFAALAVSLAAIGVYGVIAYAVAQRTREIGVRVAIGARIGDVVRLVLRGGLRLALLGIGIGLAGAVLATRLMAGMLYGVAPADPATLAAVAGALLATALFACWLPARRAAHIDPIEALRHE
jgi:putative ABC transport system permease protein